MSPEEQQIYAANYSEATRAQRTENADRSAHWFAMFMVEKSKHDALEAKVKELTPPGPVKLEAVE